MKPATITVIAHPDRIVPIPAVVRRSSTGAPCRLLGATHKATHAHELEGAITLDLADGEVASWARRRINVGDLVAVAPAAPTPTPTPTPITAAPAATAKD